MTFDEALAELQGFLDRYVVAFVLAPEASAPLLPAAMLCGRLRRGVSGETFIVRPGVENDVTFYVGADEPGLKSCLFLTPAAFESASWEDGTRLLRIESSHATILVRPLDEHEEEIEARRAEASREALVEMASDVAAELRERWADPEPGG